MLGFLFMCLEGEFSAIEVFPKNTDLESGMVNLGVIWCTYGASICGQMLFCMFLGSFCFGFLLIVFGFFFFFMR